MKVSINGEIFDSNETTIVIMFQHDEERVLVGSAILKTPKKEGPRIYCESPIGEHDDDSFKKLAMELLSKAYPE